jgi:hypothetical protein
MPAYTYTEEEREEAEKQLMIDLTAGDLIEKAEPVNAREVSAAEAIEHVFRSCLVGQDTAQTEQTGSIRNVANKVGLDPKRIRAIRDRQIEAILDGARHLMPTPQYRTGVIHRAA